MNETLELLLRYFRPPPDTHPNILAEWDQMLIKANDFGCDWLEHLQETMNPIPASAIVHLCQRLRDLELKP